MTLSKLLDQLSTDPHVRGSQFEQLVYWFLTHDPVYQSRIRQVWLWTNWPGRWGPDAGIDLVAETHEGDRWAIQAKAYSINHRITKRDVDTFLSESAAPEFAYRLIIASTNLIGRRARSTLRRQERPVGTVFLTDLNKSPLRWPSSLRDLVAPPPKTKKPRPHQGRAILDVVRGFERTQRGQLVMACGTGKTLVALWVAEALESNRTLILVPSLSLLAQTLREWASNTSRDLLFLPVCSDETVRGADNLISHTGELGYPVTTNPSQIATFLRGRGPRVLISTYHSAPRIAEAFANHKAYRFDLAIADEAHRCAGPASSDFATILDRVAIRAERRLFMTATPKYFTDRVIREANTEDYEIASMDDEEWFGPVFHRLTFGEAINQDLLSDYQVAIVGVDDPTYRTYIEEGRLVTTNDETLTDARSLAAAIAVAKSMRKYDLHRTISFHGRIKRAQAFANRFPEVLDWMPEDEQPLGKFWSDHVSGAMPSGLRDARLDRLRGIKQGERGLLTNARCLSEGVDVPTLDSLVVRVGTLRLTRRTGTPRLAAVMVPRVRVETPPRMLAATTTPQMLRVATQTVGIAAGMGPLQRRVLTVMRVVSGVRPATDRLAGTAQRKPTEPVGPLTRREVQEVQEEPVGHKRMVRAERQRVQAGILLIPARMEAAGSRMQMVAKVQRTRMVVTPLGAVMPALPRVQEALRMPLPPVATQMLRGVREARVDPVRMAGTEVTLTRRPLVLAVMLGLWGDLEGPQEMGDRQVRMAPRGLKVAQEGHLNSRMRPLGNFVWLLEMTVRRDSNVEGRVQTSISRKTIDRPRSTFCVGYAFVRRLSHCAATG